MSMACTSLRCCVPQSLRHNPWVLDIRSNWLLQEQLGLGCIGTLKRRT